MVTGPRTWRSVYIVNQALTDVETLAGRLPPYRLTLVHGNANGLDKMIAREARMRGWRIESHPADWDRHGKAGGFIRNQEMVDTDPDLCLAFLMDCALPDCKKSKAHITHGTADCIERINKAELTLWEYRV